MAREEEIHGPQGESSRSIIDFSFSGGSDSFRSSLLDVSVYMAVGQNLVPLVNIKIAGKWMFIPLKMVLIGIDS
jgi:hypothetical protein